MNNHQPTDQENKLYDALLAKGIKAIQHYYDGHKTVDIAILQAKLFIEVDGLQHFTDPEQIKSDFKRYHYSDGDDFSTFYITNQLVETHLDDVVNALVKVIEERKK